jgi:hypothetical protein
MKTIADDSGNEEAHGRVLLWGQALEKRLEEEKAMIEAGSKEGKLIELDLEEPFVENY